MGEDVTAEGSSSRGGSPTIGNDANDQDRASTTGQRAMVLRYRAVERRKAGTRRRIDDRVVLNNNGVIADNAT